MKSELVSKYKIGDIVYAKAHPAIKLHIIRFFKGIYYCIAVDDLHQREQVYAETELA